VGVPGNAPDAGYLPAAANFEGTARGYPRIRTTVPAGLAAGAARRPRTADPQWGAAAM